MRIVRYEVDGAAVFGTERADGAVDRCAGDPFAGLTPTGDVDRPARLLAPLAPPLVIGIGLNYRQHAEETRARIPEHPVVFFKNPGCVTGPADPIRLPRRLVSTKVDYEVELAVVLGRTCRDVPRESALDVVLGYTIGNDVSARDWQKEWGGSQWGRAKSFDTFCPLGPAIVTRDEVPDPGALALRSRVNGEVRQESTTADLIFDVPALIAFLTADTTLPAGTVILTGTPGGVGMAMEPPRFLAAGDVVECGIDGLGTLRNVVG